MDNTEYSMELDCSDTKPFKLDLSQIKEKEEKDTVGLQAQYRCPSCYLQWYGDMPKGNVENDKLCKFCVQPHTDLEILERQITVMDTAYVRDLPHVIRNLFNHVQLKEIE
ncbi:MAG: hypothetical protein K940chlam3_00119 [Chlamydiae bacterium]|nr:hypothetical protein [Chlamydiota bacterium]